MGEKKEGPKKVMRANDDDLSFPSKIGRGSQFSLERKMIFFSIIALQLNLLKWAPEEHF